METNNLKTILPSALVVAVFAVGMFGVVKLFPTKVSSGIQNFSQNLDSVVLPEQVVIPVRWGDLGKQMIEKGVIDAQKFEQIYASRGGLNTMEKKMLYETVSGEIIMTEENAGIILNMLWAFGLGNKNEILEKGPMMDPRYGGAGNFASTGGWTLTKDGNPMNHYSMHEFVKLTPEQQALVEKVAKNIYRPCCGNSTYFPDCNHGMAMLGLLELMAGSGVSEEEMYKVALKVNSYWFPDTYLTIAKYMEMKGVSWDKANPQEMLGAKYSSGSGFREIASQVTAPDNHGHSGGGGCGVTPVQSGPSCGVGGTQPIAKPRQSSGCGV